MEQKGFGESQVLFFEEVCQFCMSSISVIFDTGGAECYMKLPVTPGHEFSGRVVGLGPGAKDHHQVDMGDLVVAEQIIPCNQCRFCQQGQYQVCPDHTVFGFQKVFLWQKHSSALYNSFLH